MLLFTIWAVWQYDFGRKNVEDLSIWKAMTGKIIATIISTTKWNCKMALASKMYCQLFSFVLLRRHHASIPNSNPILKLYCKDTYPKCNGSPKKCMSLWLHELKPFKTDRLYSSCTIFKALALVYTQACLSLILSISGNSFLFTFNPVKHVFSHIVQIIVWGYMLRNEATDFYVSRALDRKLQELSSKHLEKSLLILTAKQMMVQVPCLSHLKQSHACSL